MKQLHSTQKSDSTLVFPTSKLQQYWEQLYNIVKQWSDSRTRFETGRMYKRNKLIASRRPKEKRLGSKIRNIWNAEA